MLKYVLLLWVLFFSVSTPGYAEDEMRLYGAPSITFNSGGMFLNFGGPSVRFESRGYFMGLSFFPSLRLNYNASELLPLLGVGAFLGKEHLFLAVPLYYYSSSWNASFGIGYKF